MRQILIFLTFTVLALLLIHPVGEMDTWMHIKTGEIMVTQHRLTYVDEYSYTKEGESWINHQWLSQVIFYVFYKFFGINSLIFLSGIVIFLAFILLFMNVYRKQTWLLSVFLMLLVILFSSDRFMARPLIFSLLLFSLFVFILHRYKYSWKAKKENLLYMLIPLQVLWVNLHGAAIMGVFLVWAYIIGEFIDNYMRGRGISRPLILRSEATKDLKRSFSPSGFRMSSLGRSIRKTPRELNYIRRDFKSEDVIKRDRYKKLLFVGVMLTVATGITPYGYEAILFPIRELKGMYLIEEWQGAIYKNTFLNFGTMPYLRIFILISAFVFIFRGRIISSAHIIIFAALLYLSLSANRHLSFYGFAVAPCIVGYMKDIEFKKIPINIRRFFLHTASLGLILYLMLLSKDIFTGSYYVKKGIEYSFRLGKIGTPDEGADFLLRSGLKGNMFNDYGSGCYLIWRCYPRLKVFIDGRNTIYGNNFILENYIAPVNDPAAFENLAKRYNINYVFFSYGLSLGNTGRLIPYLYNSKDWGLVFFDDRACIFAKNTIENAEILNKYRIDLIKRKEIVRLDKHRWQRFYPVDYINRAAFYENIGFLDTAIKILEGVARPMPYVADVRYNLGCLYLKRERYYDAIGEFNKAISINKKDVGAYNNLGIAYAKLGRYKDAMAAFRRVLCLEPLHVEAMRNIKAAKMDYEKAGIK